MRNIFGGLLLALTALIGTACGSDGSGGGTGTAAGKGSTACQSWQTAVCKFVVGCGVLSQSTCDDNYKGIACKSDAQASDCAAKFKAATCAAPPSACDITDLVDTAPAIASCNQYLDTLCAATTRCSPTTTAAACHTELAAQVDCSQAVGVSSSFETCLKEANASSCSTQSEPQSCDRAIKVLGTSMKTMMSGGSTPDGG
ncbi:MAG TPA: hypothetical protein VF395_18350 [Polyangiaceae bacterium]